MAEAAASAAIQLLLGQLITFSKEQIRLVRDFNKNFDNLKKSFDIVKAILNDAEEKQVTNTAVKAWLKQLQDLDFEADNFFDDIRYYQLRSSQVGPTRNKTMKEKVRSFLCCSCINDPTRLELGGKIKDINQKLESIHQQAREFGLQTVILNSQPPVPAIPMETNSFTVDPVFLGRENDVSMIVEKLTTAAAEQVLSVLPIVGMGGLGKTTLARKVFHHEHIISHFGDKRRVWVHVPTKFDVPNILKNILTSLTDEEVEPETSEEAILKKLQKHLRTGRYLLVLDDVWKERDKWEHLVNSLLGISSASGNCIIVTTRHQEVASIVQTNGKHELECLSEDDCWSIIQAKAFINSVDVPVEFESVGRNIARRCCGLPLAAKVVGGLFRDKSKDEWQNIEMNKLPDFGDDQNTISKILKLSFDNLPSPSLKKCFAYCSIFPKGYEIEKQQIIELWMAEGFLQTDHRESDIKMETTGSKNFNILMWNSLLQVVRSDDYGNVTHCNMHDLVHDLANSVLRENGLLQSHRYIGYESSGDELLSITKGQERYVRTLFFCGEISDIKFSDFESLHSLTLVSEDIDELPTLVGELKHLRYLDISETGIRYLSDSIGELYHLQTLRVRTEEWMPIYLEKLPDSLSHLISLRHLHIPANTSLPPEIGKLVSLQTLPCFHVGGDKGCGISELENLKNLKGSLAICNLENVRDKNEAMSADLHGKAGIYELRLEWDRDREGDEANDESVLEGLKPHPNLRKLEICGFKGKNLILWEGLDNFVNIELEECTEFEELPMLGHLPHLKSLCLDGLTNVKSIGSSFYGNIDNCRRDAIVVFRALERLKLINMSNLKEWDEVDLLPPGQVFPRLKYLKIYRCKQLTRAPSQLPCLEELYIHGMDSSLALENICGTKLTSLTRLHISEIKGLKRLPDWLFSNNHNLTKLGIWDCREMTHLVPHLGGGGAPSLLKELHIQNCSRLRELPDDLHSLNSLEVLLIDCCRNLKSIPYRISRGGGQQQPQQPQPQHGLISLRELEISCCFRLKNLPIEMVESCAKSLEVLKLRVLKSITNMGMVIGCLHRMTRLGELVIEEVPKFSSKDIIGGSLTSLQELRMRPLSSDSSWNNVSFNDAVGAMLLQSIGSLRTLHLWGKEDWDSLPDQLQHLTSLDTLHLSNFGVQALPEWFGNLTSLEELRLWNFGIEALPEWFGNLSSLEELYLEYCENLRQLPSKQAMQRLSKLTYLWIWYCPLLSKEGDRSSNNSDDDERPQIVDSEWPKISHIPTVYVNNCLISSEE